MKKKYVRAGQLFLNGNEALVAQLQSLEDTGILEQTVPGTEVTWGTIVGNIEDQTDLVNFVNELVEQIVEGEISIDLTKYALKTDLETLQKQVEAIKVPTKVSELQNDAGYLTQHQDISNLATKSELEAKADKTQLADYALKADAVTHEELADYPTKEEMDIAVNAKADATDLDALETKVDEVKAVADKAVPYFDFEYQGQQRKTIQLANYDSISGIGTDGTGYNLAMVSKWDKADFGAAGITMNLNTKDVVTINDDKVIATTEDVENAVGQIDLTPYAVKEQADKDYAHAETLVSGIVTSVFGQYYYNPYNVQVAYNVATKHGTTGDEVEYIEEPAENHNFVIDGATAEKAGVMSAADKAKLDALDPAALALSANVYTKQEVDAKIASVYVYKGSVATQTELPQENNKVGDTYNVTDTGHNYTWDGTQWDDLGGTVDFSAYLTSAVAAETYATKTELATKADITAIPTKVSDLTNDAGYLTEHQDISNLATKEEVQDVKELTPVMVQIPIRTKSTFNTVQDKETILGWFGCTQDSELKGLISRQQPMFLKYGISLSTNPHYYKMPIQYIAYESATQVKIVTVALDTNNDAISKYEILMNLDGTVIENGGNVKMTITPLVLETQYNELDAKYTALEARVVALEQA